MKPLRTVVIAILLVLPPTVAGVCENVSGRLRYPKRFAEVIPGKLYRGGFPSRQQILNLSKEKNIRTIITLTGEENKPKYWAEKRTAKALDIRLLRFAMPGNGCADLDLLDDAVNALGSALADEKHWPVFFHCAAGKQRSNALLAGYRMKVCRWPFEEAVKELEDQHGLDRVAEKVLVDHLHEYAEWIAASGSRTHAKRADEAGD